MGFRKKMTRDTSLPDFRFTFLGFEGDKARIGVGIRDVPRFVENVMVETTLNRPFLFDMSQFLSFYTAANPLLAANLSAAGKSDEIGKFMPNHYRGPYSFSNRLDEGGEVLIPKQQTTFFWLQLPANYSRSGPIYTPAFVNYLDFNDGLKIDFGPAIPSNKLTQNGASYKYIFYIPFAEIAVNDAEVSIEIYDLGDVVYLDTPYQNNQGVLNFSKISSYYDA